VGEWRAGNDDGAEQIRPHGCQQHDCPAGLTVTDDRRLALRIRVHCDHPLEKRRLRMCDVFDGLAWHRLGKEADEIAGMTRFEGNADLAVCFEAANAGPVAGAWIDNHERAFACVDLSTFRRYDADECIVDGPLQLASVHD